MIIHYCANEKQPSIEVFCNKKIIFNPQSGFSYQENCYINSNGLRYTFEKDDVTCPECRKLIDEKTIKSAYNQWWSWFDINLPYLIRTDLPKPELTIDTNAIVLEKFGYTVKTLRDNYRSKHGCGISSREYELEQEFINNHPELSEDEAIEASENDDHPDLLEIKEIHNKSNKINRFIGTIPEVIEFEKAYDEVTKQEEELNKAGCFYLSKYNRPGVLIEVQKEDGIKRFLIGDININAGSGGNQIIEEKDIVLRACELISEDFLLKMKKV
jgi:hypothetical protein